MVVRPVGEAIEVVAAVVVAVAVAGAVQAVVDHLLSPAAARSLYLYSAAAQVGVGGRLRLEKPAATVITTAAVRCPSSADSLATIVVVLKVAIDC